MRVGPLIVLAPTYRIGEYVRETACRLLHCQPREITMVTCGADIERLHGYSRGTPVLVVTCAGAGGWFDEAIAWCLAHGYALQEAWWQVPDEGGLDVR